MTDETIFATALAQADPAARAAYLTEVCAGDPDGRRRVEGLLVAHEKAGGFLEKSPIPLAAPDRMRTEDLSASETDPSEPDDAVTFLNPPGRPDSLGRIGHYEALEILGKGGFGIVFRTFDEVLQRVVAIKVLSPQLAATSPARKRFLREARSSAKVRHENVVQVYAVEEQPLPYLVMEFIPGETLQQRLDRTGPLETPEVLQIGRQIALGLAAAHAQGLIHRDIKPGNILIEAGPNQHVKITDFGLARAADDASLSRSGIIAGTPMYMAPEQAHGDTLDHRADLFSLGSVLYTMASGRPPFRANNTLAVLKRVAEDTPRPIPEIIPEVPPWLCDLIARLHAKKPDDRIGTAKEVADLLGRGLTAIQGAIVTSLPVAPPIAVAEAPREDRAPAGTVELPRPAPALRPRSRARFLAVAAAVFLTLLGGLGITEATGVSNVRGTVIRVFSPEGTLVVEVDDPGVSVKIDGSDVVITGAGAHEIRVKPGQYKIQASKDGKLLPQQFVTITKNGKEIVKISQEAPPGVAVADGGGKGPDPKTAPPGKKPPVAVLPPVPTVHDAWIKALATLPLDQQGAALVAKMKAGLPGFEDAFLNQMATMPADRQVFLLTIWLKERNPGFDGKFTHKIEDGIVTSLELPAPLVQDLTPLRALINLRTLTCRSTVGWDNNAENDTAVLGALAALETINDKPVAQFWKEVKAKRADFEEFLKVVPALTAEQQLAAVAARLKKHNPGFGGQVDNKIEGGMVTEIRIEGNVTDLSPVRALVGLKVLSCTGGPLSDLSPLKGLSLTSLDAGHTQVHDLSPLKGMKLTRLDLSSCQQVRDLSPLKGLSLTELYLSNSQVRDLSPLKGMKLTSLDLAGSPVSDLSPLEGMPLTGLNFTTCSQRL